MARRYDCSDATDRAAGLREATSADQARRARRAAHRHPVRHRRGRLHAAGRRATCWRPRAAAATCPRRCWSARPNTLHGLVTGLLRAGLGAGRRLLARRAHPRRQAPAVADLGPRRHPRHRRGPDAAAPGRDRTADRHRSDGGLQRQPDRASRAATTATPRRSMLGDSVSVYLDGGPTPRTVPSSIVDVTGQVARAAAGRGDQRRTQLREVVPDLEGAIDRPPAWHPGVVGLRAYGSAADSSGSSTSAPGTSAARRSPSG